MIPAETGKVTTLQNAVAEHIRNDDMVFVGGFGQGVPFALGREIIRQEKRGLTLCRTGADILFDLLIAAGCATRIVVGWIGNPGIGLSHVTRRAIRAGNLALEETSNFGLVLRLHAGALGVPFLPTLSLIAGDIAGHAPQTHKLMECPFTGQAIMAVPALTPDVAIIHGLRADPEGNVQLDGIIGDTTEGALASRRVICSVEEIVSSAEIRAVPGRTILPASKVTAICAVPFGAHPSYVAGRYDRDDAAYFDFDRLSRDAAQLERFISETIFDLPDHAGYVKTCVPDGIRVPEARQ